MRIISALFGLIFLLQISGRAQDIARSVNSDSIFAFTDDPPKFPGGEEAKLKFIETNLKISDQLKDKGVCGTVYCTFVIDTTGSISEAKIIRTFDRDVQLEALKVVRSMPLWEPARFDGRAVKYQYNLPIKFHFEGCTEVKPRSIYEKLDNNKKVLEAINSGNKALELQQYDEAEYHFTIALEIVPSADIFYNRGLAKLGNNNDQGFCEDMFIAAAYRDTIAKRLYAENCLGVTGNDSTNGLNKNAEFIGGEKAQMNFIVKNIVYPDYAKDNEIMGAAIIKCTVETDGSLTNLSILSSPDVSLSNEAIRVTRLMPKWRPKTVNGTPVTSHDVLISYVFVLR